MARNNFWPHVEGSVNSTLRGVACPFVSFLGCPYIYPLSLFSQRLPCRSLLSYSLFKDHSLIQNNSRIKPCGCTCSSVWLLARKKDRQTGRQACRQQMCLVGGSEAYFELLGLVGAIRTLRSLHRFGRKVCMIYDPELCISMY